MQLEPAHEPRITLPAGAGFLAGARFPARRRVAVSASGPEHFARDPARRAARAAHHRPRLGPRAARARSGRADAALAPPARLRSRGGRLCAPPGVRAARASPGRAGGAGASSARGARSSAASSPTRRSRPRTRGRASRRSGRESATACPGRARRAAVPPPQRRRRRRALRRPRQARELLILRDEQHAYVVEALLQQPDPFLRLDERAPDRSEVVLARGLGPAPARFGLRPRNAQAVALRLGGRAAAARCALPRPPAPPAGGRRYSACAALCARTTRRASSGSIASAASAVGIASRCPTRRRWRFASRNACSFAW